MKIALFRVTLVLSALVLAAMACSAPSGGTAPAPTQTAVPPLIPTMTAAPTLPTATPEAENPTSTVAPTLPPANTPTTPPMINQVTFYMVALEDGGKSGPAIGCGDSLVAVTQPVKPVTPTTMPVQAALGALFAIKEQHVGQSGLYNALYQSNLVVDSVRVLPSGLAEVALSGQMLLGGVCDSPRFKAQIEQTIMAQPGISATNVTINGKTLDQVLSEK